MLSPRSMHVRNPLPCWAFRPITSAYGRFFIPKRFGISVMLTAQSTLRCCIAVYMRCVRMT